MKKLTFIVAIMLSAIVLLSSCGQSQTPTDTGKTQNNAVTAQSGSSESTTDGGKVLVVYFSATGTTKAVAERIAAYTGADLYEIQPKETYTSADLDWNDRNSRTTKEQKDRSCRPELGGEELNLDGYTTMFIGYPIWWGEEPRILDTFVEKYSFDGITCIPFCTSGGSGVGKSDKHLKENTGSGTWKDGKLLNAVSDDKLQSWIDSVR